MNFDIRDFGAEANSLKINTKAIQAAIDACHQSGGGTVVICGGVYKSGGLFLKSNVELRIERGAVLQASTDRKDYFSDVFCQLYEGEPHMDGCFLFCKDAQNVALTGGGCIDGNGAAFLNSDFRPMLLRWLHCKKIHLEGLRLVDPASWTNDFVCCQNISARGLRIESRANWNGDGLDFNACEGVIVSDCFFDCSDDCICLQNSEEDHICRDVVVTNCIFRSHWAGMRIGLLSCGDIRNLTVSNCIFRDIECSGIKIQACEGGNITDLLFENLVMEEVCRPVFITQNRYRRRIGRPQEVADAGRIERVFFRDLSFREKEGAVNSCMIIDSEQMGSIRDVYFDRVFLRVSGGVTGDYCNPHNVHKGVQAEAYNYSGNLPASGLYCTGAENVCCKDFTVRKDVWDGREDLVFQNDK